MIGAVFLALGIFGTPLIRLATRVGSGDGRVERDERDEQIEAKATSVGLIAIMLIVFLGCIWLWEYYRADGCVPVGWMWIIAYSTLILSHLAPVIISLLLDFGVVSHGES